MSKPIQYSNESLVVIEFIPDFLPSPEQFANKAPRRKQQGINCALQSEGFQPAFARRDGKLNPEEIKMKNTKVTIALTSESVEDFKEAAKNITCSIKKSFDNCLMNMFLIKKVPRNRSTMTT